MLSGSGSGSGLHMHGFATPEGNTCEHPRGCSGEVDEPGLLCRRHWSRVPRVLRESYVYIRKMVLRAVVIEEEQR